MHTTAELRSITYRHRRFPDSGIHRAINEPVPLSLMDIAYWQLPAAQKSLMQQPQPPILAALPSLQRGAVWKPNQIELLWDSILRGFPIGSLVVCEKLTNQASRGIGVNQDSGEFTPTHHLLDGQQRAGAIGLGFLDPYPDPGNSDKDVEVDTLLWLDLAPEDLAPDSELFLNSTRNYLLRVTTKAHPWGFNISESRETTKRLSAEYAKQSLEAFNCNKSVKNGERPHPIQGWPYAASAPIPLAWLLIEAQSILGKSGALITPEKSVELWRKIMERCQKFIEGRNPLPSKQPESENHSLVHWAYRVQEILKTWLEQPQAPQLLALAEALARAVSTQLIALLVPAEALTQPSRNEEVQAGNENNKSATTDRIANVEHLFQRLNAGGTELRSDDLAYSMIKAYWPGIEKTIQNIETRPPETQVALLGAQLALAVDDNKLPPPLSVTMLRTLARIDGNRQQPSDDNQKAHQLECIKTMFALKGQVSSEAPIKLALQRLDKWFLYDDVNRDQRWGLPPVLRSRMAEQAPEVFLFLLRLTHHTTQEPEPDVRRKLLGLATALHWFSQDRQRAVRWLWETSPAEWCDGSAFSNNKKPLLTQLHKLPDDQRQDHEYETVANILTPKQLSDYISIDTFNKDRIDDWQWWNTLVVEQAKEKGEKADERWAKYGSLIKILKDYNYRNNNGLLLMYAQREQMAAYFRDYDSSHIGYWDAHNVPWDFDHILPQNTFSNMKTDNDLMEVCKQWGNTIANLHIYPFEKNRSRQDEKANKSLPRDESTRMLLNPSELDTFSLETKDIRFNKDKPQNSEAPRKVYEFALAARTRLLRIYGEWYDNLLIGHLLQSDNQSTISQASITADNQRKGDHNV